MAKPRTRTVEEQRDEVLDEVKKDADEPAKVEIPEERNFTFRTPGFSRMRFEWRTEDHMIVTTAQQAVERRIIDLFPDAYQVMYEVYEVVRTQMEDQQGNPLFDNLKLPIWKRKPSGAWEEDFTKLSLKQKEHFLFKITTNLFAWEQQAADLWGEAMFAKAQWEERFAIAFDAPMSGTVDDRRAAGNIDAAEERYFAIFLSLLSRKADAVVRSLALLGQRLKDSMV